MKLNRIKEWLNNVHQFLKRHRKLLPVFSFISGTGSFLLLERGEAVARMIPLVLIGGWLVFPLVRYLKPKLTEYIPENQIDSAAHLFLQGIHQESFFFTIPFLIGSTVWPGPTMAFTILVCFAGLLSLIDPIYFKQLLRYRVVLVGYHTLALFTAMMVSLPVVFGLSAEAGLLLAAGIAACFGGPTLFQATHYQQRWRWIASGCLVLFFCTLLWFGRRYVPPAPMSLVDSAMSTQMDAATKQAVNPRNRFKTREVSNTGLYAYTALRAPLGLKEPVVHVWRKDRQVIDRISLEISGGRKEGFRTWSHKRNFPRNLLGKWQLDIETDSGQLIGSRHFEITE